MSRSPLLETENDRPRVGDRRRPASTAETESQADWGHWARPAARGRSRPIAGTAVRLFRQSTRRDSYRNRPADRADRSRVQGLARTAVPPAVPQDAARRRAPD